MRKILFISRDPGGTNQLVALRDILLGEQGEAKKSLFQKYFNVPDPFDIIIVAKDFARATWLENGVEPLCWPDLDSVHDITMYVMDFSASHIVTSTCHLDDRTEQLIWRLAKRLAVKTTAFLDSGLNIEARFRNDSGNLVFPDQLSVNDEETIPHLLSLGFPQENLLVSGDLYQNFIKKNAHNYMQNILRTEWGATATERIILFASDYVREMQALGVQFEITEFECLNCLIDMLTHEDASEDLKGMKGPFRLIIRPHPKDTDGKYDAYPQMSTKNLHILVNGTGSAIEAISTSDLVAGLGSSLLGEAKTLDVDVLELAPIVQKNKARQKIVS